MADILPRTHQTLEDALEGMLKYRDALREQCRLARKTLTKIRTEDEQIEDRYELIDNSNGMVKLQPTSSLCDKYTFKVSTKDAIYCFESLDDLLNRIVTPEELEDTNNKKTHAFQTLNHYISLKVNPNHKNVQARQKFAQKMDQLAERELETWSLVDDDLVNKFRTTLAKVQIANPRKERDLLKELERENYGREQEKELETYEEYIRLKVRTDLLEDLKGRQFSKDELPEVYKTVSALQDIRKLKRPILVKKCD